MKNTTFKCNCSTCEYHRPCSGSAIDGIHVAPGPTCPPRCNHHSSHSIKLGRLWEHHDVDDYVFWDEGTYECIDTNPEPWQDPEDIKFTVQIEADGSSKSILGLDVPHSGAEFLSELLPCVIVLKVA